jgi:hypothetical protein
MAWNKNNIVTTKKVDMAKIKKEEKKIKQINEENILKFW